MNNNIDYFEEFLINRISSINNNYFKIYKLNSSINMNQFLKILNLKPIYKNKTPITADNTRNNTANNTADNTANNTANNTADNTANNTADNTADNTTSIITNWNEKECAICYEKIQKNVYIRKLICNHEFHKKCIDKWLFTQFKQHNNVFTCPICRQSCK